MYFIFFKSFSCLKKINDPLIARFVFLRFLFPRFRILVLALDKIIYTRSYSIIYTPTCVSIINSSIYLI